MQFINQLSKAGGYVLKDSLRAYTREVARAIKAQMPRKLRGAIGERVKVTKREITAKVGAAVGRKKKQATTKARKKGRGVGISSRNIHWWLLGTGDRKTKKTNANRGRMPGHPDLIPQAYRSSRVRAFQAMANKAKQKIQQQAQKARRK